MNKTPENTEFIDETKEAIVDYVDTKTALIKLQVAESAAKIISTLFSSIVLLILGFMFLVFLSVMFGLFFSKLFESTIWGFGLISGIYLLLFLVILFARKQLIELPLVDKIIQIIFDQNED